MSSSALKLLAASGATDSATYVDDLFSTFLFTGNGSDQTITNGVDLSGEGGLVWTKSRSTSSSHELFDTARGVNQVMYSDGSNDSDTLSNSLKAFNSGGFTMGNNVAANVNNRSGCSWTFRKAPGFFDIVKYTGTGSARDIAHNLGSVPGMVIIKSLDRTYKWIVSHRSLANLSEYLSLSENSAKSTDANVFGSSSDSHTATTFHVGTDSYGNQSGDEYIAYLFAHDAQDFGTGSDEAIIKCGTFTTDGSGNATVSLGWEPQFILRKAASSADYWHIADMMRGFNTTNTASLYPNTSDPEYVGPALHVPTADGFEATATTASTDYIYMAIRRPFKPASEFAATSLYATAPQQAKVAGSLGGFRAGFVADFALKFEQTGTHNHDISCRLAAGRGMYTDATNAEAALSVATYDFQDGMGDQSLASTNNLRMLLRRAPGFFDVVAYTGNATAGRTVAHNLGSVPEMIWVKGRDLAGYWQVYNKTTGNNKRLILNSTGAEQVEDRWANTDPTSGVFTVGLAQDVNGSTKTYIAYLFASVAGISKVGSYTGTGSDLNVDCGFSAGARFVMIKRTDSSGDWYVWDSYRGIVAGNDPYLLLNSAAAQVTNTDYVDPLASGFTVTSSAPAALNNNGGTYIFYAIA